jgi:hypothetical protein
VEGGSPSCCAAARGSTIRTTPAPPSGTATIRTLTTPTLASVPAASPPQHPSPSEPLEGIPAGVPEGSRPAPVIGDPRWLGLPRASDRTIRTAPAHCPMALVTWVIRWAFAALTLTPPPPRQGRLAAAAPAARPRCAAPAGSALRGQQSNRAAIAAPSGDRPSPAGARCRWREGKPWWYREGQRPCSPEGHPPPNPIRIPGPLSTKAARAQRGYGGRSAECESLGGALEGEPRSCGAAGELQLEPHTSPVRCRCGVSCAAAMPLTVHRPGRDLVRSCLSGCAASRRQRGDEPPWLNLPRCRQASPAGRRGR